MSNASQAAWYRPKSALQRVLARIHGLAIIGLVTLVHASFGISVSETFAGGQEHQDPTAKPDGPLNILWLTVEDMSPWIGPYGDKTVPTPHLDRLAAEGITYDNAFADSPVCAPARTALITGCYPTRIGAMHMRTRSRSKSVEPEAYVDIPLYEAVPPPSVRCFPEYLRAAGYYTTNRSKKDYQFRAPQWTWDDSSRKADYSSRPAGAPFFSVYNHGGTHESQAFPEAKRRPAVVAPEELSLPPIYPDTPAVRDALARTYNNIAEMDAWVGRELERLDRAGLAESTVVFFYSDHGVGLPRGKRSLYGTGTRVPLLIRFPKGRGPADLPPGSRTDRIVSFIDFGATALSLAGIEPPQDIDGLAFLGPHAGAPRTLAFFHADRFDAVRDRARAVTDGRRLVIRNLLPDRPHLIANAYRERIPMTADLYALRENGALAGERTQAQWQVGSTERPVTEWYDRSEDPWETASLVGTSLAADEQAAFDALEDALDDWIRAGDLGLVDSESELVRTALWPPRGEQPTTAQPFRNAQGGFSSATPGASIGYSIQGSGRFHPAPGGLVPPLAPGTRIEVKAHRLGYQPSPSARFTVR